MEWVHEEGHCDASMRDWDWVGFGLRLATEPTGAEELEWAKAAVTKLTGSMTKAELFAEAQRREVLLAPVTTPEEIVASEHLRERGYWDVVDGRVCPGAFVKASGWALPTLSRPPEIGSTPCRCGRARSGAVGSDGHAHGDLPLAGLKSSTSAGCSPALTAQVLMTSARPSSRSRVHRPASRGGGALRNDLGIEGSVSRTSTAASWASVSTSTTKRGGDPRRPGSWADVLIESYTPGVMTARGLDYESLQRINPRLVMMSTSLMGHSGPLSNFAGFGNLAGAITGFYELTGWPDRSPAGPFLAYTDYVAPRFGVAALLAALDWRRRTGRGQFLDFSQAEAAIHFSPAILDHTVNGSHPTPWAMPTRTSNRTACIAVRATIAGSPSPARPTNSARRWPRRSER
jgi:hypothetical protein